MGIQTYVKTLTATVRWTPRHSALVSFGCAAMTFLVWSSCGSSYKHVTGETSAASAASSGGTGCVQGSLYDGLTGDHLPVPNGDQKHGIQILAGANVLTASARTNVADPAANTDLAGDFVVCGVPLDVSLPVFAFVDGYLPFESRILVASTATPKAQAATSDLPLGSPIQTVNIRTYPVGTQTLPLHFKVTNSGSMVSGATVEIRPTGADYLDLLDSSNFLAPIDARMKSISVTTDQQGEALFPASGLVLGGRYNYVVIPPSSQAQQTVAVSVNGNFIVGLSSGTTDPYQVIVDLSQAQPALAVVSTSIDSGDASPTGSLSFVFNRDVELAPGTIDSMVATLQNANGAVLAPNQPNNSASEQVSAVANGNILTLTPIFDTKAGRTPDPHREPGLRIVYSGITVRTASSPDDAVLLPLPATTVSFFGGSSETPVALKLLVTQGAGQAAKASTLLPQSVYLELVDQFGHGMPSQSITVATDPTNGGTIRSEDGSGPGSQSTTLTTDDDGLVKLVWTLGATTGAQLLVATSAGVDPLTVSATGQ